MKHFTRIFFAFYFLIISFYLPAESTSSRSHRVMVSIAPYAFFIKAIADDTVKIELLVPQAASFHTYEPTPKQVLDCSKSDIWFRVGENFEGRPLQAFQAYYPNMRVVDLRDGIDLITDGVHCHCCHTSADLHMWLSPRIAKTQAKVICTALCTLYPEHNELYQKNLALLMQQLDTLDQEIQTMLEPLKSRLMMVSHPAYAYLARDYNLKQIPIEFEGKDPSPRQLTVTLQQARTAGIKTIFTQNQYSSKGANLIANQLHAKVVELDPYSGNYFSAMREIARQIAAQEESK